MSTTEYITLKGGSCVSVAALRLAWDLEARGLHLRVADGKLSVGPRTAITPDDDDTIKTHRDQLMAIVNYCDEVTL